MGSTDKVTAKTVYLPDREIAALGREAAAAGRSGISAQIRHVLNARRLVKESVHGRPTAEQARRLLERIIG